MSGDRLSVKTICKLTGINEHTLRAWERRYQIVQPDRLENGRRVYSLDDLEKLKLINKLLGHGFLIGHISTYTDRELTQLLQEINHRHPGSGSAAGSGHRTRALVLEALSSLELLKLQKVLEKSQIEFGVRFIIYEVCLPLLSHLDEMVDGGDLQFAHFQTMHQVLHHHLLQTYYALSTSLHPKKLLTRSFVATAVKGGKLELETLMASMICALNEFPVHFFDRGLEPDSLASAVSTIEANTLILGVDSEPGSEALLGEFIEQIACSIQSRCEIWVFRTDAYDRAHRAALPLRAVTTLQELDQNLASVR